MTPDDDFPGELADKTEAGILWPDPARGPYYLVGHWLTREGRPECVGLEIWKGCIPGPDRRRVKPTTRKRVPGLGGTELRSLRLPAILSALWHLQQDAQERQWNEDTWPPLHDLLERFGTELVEAAQAGDVEAMDALVAELNEFSAHLPEMPFEGTASRQKRNDPVHLAKVAAVYRRAANDPLPRPTKAVAEHFHVSHSAATKWVGQARALGLLPPTTSGRPSPVTTKPSPKKRRPRREEA